MSDAEYEDVNKMENILKSHGIEMRVSGCGCCGSPSVIFEYNGEIIVDRDDCNFDTDGLLDKTIAKRGYLK